jgi:NitT/TauT family transport system permease protein
MKLAWLAPLGVIVAFLVVWDGLVLLAGKTLFPRPHLVAWALADMARDGVLFRYSVASLFRVLWGFALATLVGVPLGLAMGWFSGLYRALNPLLQLLRPISPIAWIPVAILWFGVTDRGPIFLIFLAGVFPIALASAAAVRNIPQPYVRAARNFGVTGVELFLRIILPATLPQILTGLRIALGIAWLVVVAAEMIVTDHKSGGLGYLVIDARNQGSRYDLVVAAMVVIGVIGLILDLGVRQIEKLDEVKWGYSQR